MTRAEFDTLVAGLTPNLRETLMQLALDNDHDVTLEEYAALERCGLVAISGRSAFGNVYYMPTHIHIQCIAWMAEMYEEKR